MVKKRTKFNYNKDRRRIFKKSKKQKNINCLAVKQSWDDKKTLKVNMQEMGLVENPNIAFPIPKTHENLPGIASTSKSSDVTMKVVSKKKKNVIKALEDEAKTHRDPAKLNLLSEPECTYLARLMNTYGDDYKAMAKDRRNFYQYTASQIRHKITKFKNTPKHYDAYLAARPEQMEVK